MISIYTDGASSSKSGKPGAYAYILIRTNLITNEESIITARTGINISTSNNKMELTAAIEGLKEAIRYKFPRNTLIELVSDSQYVCGMINNVYQPSKNLSLVQELQKLVTEANLARCRWVPGHSGNKWNEEVDRLAGEAKQICLDTLSSTKKNIK